jgi:hypothetical protein
MHIVHRAPAHDLAPSPEIDLAPSPPARRRLRLVIVQEAPGVWMVRGLEHEVLVEGRSIGAAVRAAINFVQAHDAFDIRHDLKPLSAFPPAPPSFWNAYSAGTPVSLTQLGIVTPATWDICAAVANRRP